MRSIVSCVSLTRFFVPLVNARLIQSLAREGSVTRRNLALRLPSAFVVQCLLPLAWGFGLVIPEGSMVCLCLCLLICFSLPLPSCLPFSV